MAAAEAATKAASEAAAEVAAAEAVAEAAAEVAAEEAAAASFITQRIPFHRDHSLVVVNVAMNSLRGRQALVCHRRPHRVPRAPGGMCHSSRLQHGAWRLVPDQGGPLLPVCGV